MSPRSSARDDATTVQNATRAIFSGGDCDPVAECKDRVENGAHRIRERAGMAGRLADGAAPSDKTGAVGLVFGHRGKLAFHHAEMGRPDFRLVGRAAPPRCNDSAELGEVLRLDEHL